MRKAQKAGQMLPAFNRLPLPLARGSVAGQTRTTRWDDRRKVRDPRGWVVLSVMCLGLVASIAGEAGARAYVPTAVDPNVVRLFQYTAGGPTGIWWNYGNGGTFPGGSCQNLQLPASASQSERSRFYALFLAAKLARKTVIVHYYPDDCTLMDFDADGW